MDSLFQEFDSLEMNELHRAVHTNDVETVEYLVEKGVDIANTINKGQTPLHLAANLSYDDIMKKLLEGKSREEARTLINRRTVDTGTTALHLAARKNSLEITKFLLSRGANYEIRDNENRQPKHQTIDKRILQLIDRIEVVFESTPANDSKILLTKLNLYSGGSLEPVLYARNCQGFTSLQLAMEKNHLDAVATIVNFRIKKMKQKPWQTGAKLDKLMRHSKAARLHLSNLDAFCHENHESMVDVYVKKDVVDLMCNAHEFLEAYMEQRNCSLDEQPMLIIIEESLEFFGSWKASQFIGNKRVDMMLRKGPIFTAQMLKLCIVVPTQFFMRLVYTAELLQAAKRNDLVLVKKCLTGHPAINETDVNDRTALRYAFERKNYEMAKMLLKFGADPTNKKKAIRQVKPLLLLALDGLNGSEHKIDILQLLFDRVSDDKLLDFVSVKHVNYGGTVLHWASHDIRFLQFFMSKGAIYCARTDDNRMPKDYFCRHRRVPVRNMFDNVDWLFSHACNGRAKELVQEMKKFDVIELLAAGGTRNEQGLTLVQVLEVKGHVDEAEQIRKLLSSEECEYYKRSVAGFFYYGTRVYSSNTYVF